MKLIDFNDVWVEAAKRHDASCLAEGSPLKPFAPDPACVALVSAALDEMNLRLGALGGWE